jgi:U2 small nuclear ribonucleoprotein A'
VIENLGATLDFFDCIDLSDNEIKKLGNFSVLLRFFYIPVSCFKFFLLNRLKSLILNNNKIHKIQNISDSLPNLENLCLMSNKITELSELDNLSDCKNLKRLVLFNNAITHVQTLTHLTRLQTIDCMPSQKYHPWKYWTSRK